MVRTALRGTTARSALRGADTAELLDRTGIIAASLPQRRRAELKAGVASAAAAPDEPHSHDLDLRPRSVVIHRRARTWMGAVALLAIGWLAGGTFGGAAGGTVGGKVADNATQVEVQQNVAEQPVVVPPAPPSVVSVTATGTIQVPAEQPHVIPGQSATSKAQRPAVKAPAEPRMDLPVKPTTGKLEPLAVLGRQVSDLWSPFVASLPYIGALSSRQ